MSKAPPQAVERVRRLLADTVHIDVPTTDIDLIEEGCQSRWALVELIFQLEQESGVSIALDEHDIDHSEP